MPDPETIHELLARNLAEVRERIEVACATAGREPASVELVAVTKYAEVDWIRPLPSLGVRAFGESRPQQLVERAELGLDVEWHLVGHLQRNKIRRTLPAVAWIHSVDTLRLLQAIDRIAGEDGHRPRLLLEVNVCGEASKDGFSPEELRRVWSDVARCRNVVIEGLMTMPAFSEDESDQRVAFRRLREFRDELRDAASGDLPLPELSMGTSHDFGIAIEEGATKIRIGRTLFRGLRDG